MADRLCHEWTALDLVAAFREGSISLKDYVDALLEYGRALEPSIEAWAHHSDEVVRLQMQRLDEIRGSGESLPSLFGVPVGIKDNIDTEDYPTEWGWKPTEGRTPSKDAFLVYKLRQAGALIWGKTRTTELAFMTPTITKNPRNLQHTPGGSSSGSAAAVAAGMVPIAVGTQTNGSVIRPASFCGIYGFKPTRGLISNAGLLTCSQSLDQVGVFARTVSDLAAVSEVMIGGYESDQGGLVFPMSLVDASTQGPPCPPKLMFVRTPHWGKMDSSARNAFEALVEELKDCMVEVELPEVVSRAEAWHSKVMDAEMSSNLGPIVRRYDQALASAKTMSVIERGEAVSATEYLYALAGLHRAAAGFDEFFDHFDSIVTPSSLGAAPKGFGGTGDPIMCTTWTLAGFPCVSAPLLETEDGFPIGVQFVGPLRQDAKLLRTVNWCVQRLTTGVTS
jgi:Asp-tRNA(Asn)/Glu-tRNA(Gln) amidotransferase A subunit family amidase